MKLIVSLIIVMLSFAATAESYKFSQVGEVKFEKLAEQLVDWDSPFTVKGAERVVKIEKIQYVYLTNAITLFGQLEYKLFIDVSGHKVKCRLMDYSHDEQLMVSECQEQGPKRKRPKNSVLVFESNPTMINYVDVKSPTSEADEK